MNVFQISLVGDNDDFCEPSYFTVDGDIIYVALNKNKPQAPQVLAGELAAVNRLTGEIVWRYTLPNYGGLCDEINAAPLLFENRIIIASRYSWSSLDRDTGAELWSKAFKELNSNNLSLINGTLFCCRGTEIQTVDPLTGKTLSKRKHRVKWLDSAIQKHQGRYFAATGSSKIIEIVPNQWDIAHEFKYAGGWAIAAAPHFHGQLMVSSSYAGEIIAFNLESNEPEWKMKKKAGSRPQQAFFAGQALFYDGNTDHRLQLVELSPKKKLWSRQLTRMQACHIRSEAEFLVVCQTADRTFNLGRFDMLTGELICYVTSFAEGDWSLYPYDLWSGVAIYEDERCIVTNFRPNELIVINK
ncbi:outer membrane protein assembly factor BamB family protein [Paenibacillus sp. Leaf72]|uniref:outer membrane protein assembly factor BamB family protein n=1 Tax=Paenibacillus sp. Leaf72 TaxID=1736234 RepID=UPI0006F7F115|nr:PQQ-binding-like beta-propeller repeat protein [Paenibacillus sp. Leaf72]KQO01111.1 hypothetical protein ASF12_14775 [Paenibacillus sp. Leaf72]